MLPQGNAGRGFGLLRVAQRQVQYPHRLVEIAEGGEIMIPGIGQTLRINGRAALRVLEEDPAAGFTVMRRLAGLIARYLASPGVR